MLDWVSGRGVGVPMNGWPRDDLLRYDMLSASMALEANLSSFRSLVNLIEETVKDCLL